MLKKLPWLVLLLGLVGLGFLAPHYVAKPIQSQIANSVSTAVGDGTRHRALITVSGRDIAVSGTLHDAAERDALLATLSDVAGQRIVSMDQVKLLRVADPYTATISKSEQRLAVVSDIPDATMGANLVGAFLGQADVDYTLGSGMPDAGWPTVLKGAADVLDLFEFGQIDVKNTVLTVTGRAKKRDGKAALEAYASALPDGYSLDISAVDYPKPYDFTQRKQADGSVSLTGLAPETFQPSADVNADALTLKADGDPAKIAAHLDLVSPVLADLKSYEVRFEQLSEPQFVVTGVAKPNIDLDAFAAKRVAAGLTNADIEMPVPFDVQFSLDAVKGAQLVGLAPEGFDPQVIATNLGIPSINTDNFEIGGRGDSAELSGQISNLKPVLEDVETLELGLDGAEGASPEVVAATLPNADPARVSAFLKEIFVSLKEIDVAPTTNVYVDGQERTNGITGVREQYQAGYWIPLVTVTDASAAGCKAITDSILGDRKIIFESGRAKLDASSRVVINRLTGVISSCLAQAALDLELAGHTDKSGDPAVNMRLSIARVNTVRDALVTRGIDAARMQTIGYGETRPIGDNATKEGRSANRRTELDWIASASRETQPAASTSEQ